MNPPIHETPSPLKPGRQAQLNDPSVFVHVAFKLQLSKLRSHSLMSEKTKKNFCYQDEQAIGIHGSCC